MKTLEERLEQLHRPTRNAVKSQERTLLAQQYAVSWNAFFKADHLPFFARSRDGTITILRDIRPDPHPILVFSVEENDAFVSDDRKLTENEALDRILQAVKAI